MTTTAHVTATQSNTKDLGSSSAPQEKISLLAQIQAKCEYRNYPEAANSLQIQLRSLEGVKGPELVETYRLVLVLLPYLFDLLKADLEAGLKPLLAISSHLPEQQHDLAMGLGELNEKMNRTLLAMNYYATAARIERHFTRITPTADGAASSLLLKTLCQYFKETLDEARSSKDQRRVDSCGRNGGLMIRLCSTPMEASAFYDVLGELCNGPKPAQIDLGGSKITATYRAALDKWRSLFASKQLNTREFQRDIFMGARDFFEVLLKQALNVLGDPPCEFDIRAIGPLGREEMCPYSGFGMMILIKDARHTAYFTRLAEILELQMTALGETPDLSLPFTCLPFSDSFSGFHLDPRGNPAGEDRLIQTPQAMASLQKRPSADLQSVEYSTLRSSSLIANGIGLFETYVNGLKIVMNNDQRQAYARELLIGDLANFRHEWGNAHNPNPHLERQYSEMLDRLLIHLALYWGLESTNPLDIIEDFGTKDAIVVNTARGEPEEFSSRGVFKPNSIAMLKEAVESLYRLRVRAHLHYGMAKEEFATSGLRGASSSRMMSPYVMPQEEQRVLEQVYHLVLSPLYSRLATVVDRERDFECVFYQLDFPLLAFTIATSNPSLASIPASRSLIAQLVGHLVKSRAPIEEHILYYEQLLKVPETEPLCETYVTSLEELGAREAFACLERMPNSAGLRRVFIRQGQQLLASVNSVTTHLAPSENERCVKIFHSSFAAPRFLSQEVIHQILNEKGDIRHHYKGSAHPVTPVISGQHHLHFKQKPTHPLMEDAMHDLFFRIGGDLTPATELFRFEVRVGNKTKMYPVLISTTIRGTTLKDSVDQRLILPEKQWERLTWMRLCTVLTYSGDGRLSNYLLDPQLDIHCVDNEVSLLPPVLKSGWSRKITFCSALFCHLEPTRPLPTTVLREFCALDADAILHGWIQDIISKEPSYVSLFSKDELDCLLSEDPENKFKATILLQKGALSTLNNQFYHMQEQIRKALREGKALNSLDLLSFLIDSQGQGAKNTVGPYVHQAYKEALALPNVEARLQGVTSRTQDRSMRSAQADQLTYGRVPTFREMEERNHFSPEAARGELFDVLLHSVVGHVQVGRARSGRVLAANFVQFKDLARQRLVLEALIAKFKENREKPTAIILQNCPALGSKELEMLLHDGLQMLDLRGGTNIQDKDIGTIQQRCPNLRLLNLSGCPQLKSFCGGWVSATPLEFGNLTTLHIDHCDRLTTLQIKAPLLTSLRADTNPLLSQLVVMSQVLPGADSYKDCRILGRANIKLVQLPAANM